MDYDLRRAERDFLSGEPEAEERWIRYCARMGLHFRNHKREEELTEREETQQDYDDLWWHAKRGLKCGLWGTNGVCKFWDVDFKKGLFKAHHTWGHPWGGQNSKRKTLRTHRNSKHKARNHRLPKPHKVKRQDDSHQRRRKKRYGGRERLYGREWVWDPQAERYKVVYWCRVPDSDE